MTPKQLIELASTAPLPPILLLLGEDLSARKKCLGLLRQKATEGSIPGFNDQSFHASDSDISQILSSARTPPMMGPHRLVEVHGLQQWEKNQIDNLDALALYAEDPTESTVVLLISDKLDKRRKLFTALNKAGRIVHCETPGPRELPSYLVEEATARDCKLSLELAHLLVEILGAELPVLIDAIERLSLFVGEGGTIDEAALTQHMSLAKSSTVWELLAAMGKRNPAEALRALHYVYDPQDRGLRLLGLIAWSTRQLIKFSCALRDGASPEEAAKYAGAPPFKARELQAQIKALSLPLLESWLLALAECDAALKGGSKIPPERQLEELVLQMCGQVSSRH